MMDRLINILVSVLLIDMMLAVGLDVKPSDLRAVVGNWRLSLQALAANYVCVPGLTLGLLILVRPADPMVSAGFLILAVCPGAPFGPLCTRIAKGDVAVAVGLMVLLAGSSVIAAPVLLQWLLPWICGDAALQVDVLKIVGTLLATQLIPLCAGMWLHHRRPRLAEQLKKPSDLISAVLGVSTIGLILIAQFRSLAEINLGAWLAMTALLVGSFASGWSLGGPSDPSRRALTLTTALRNVGVGLVIATGSFPGTAAVTAAMAYGIFEILGSLLLAWAWAGASARQGKIEATVLGEAIRK
jgi:BASS family bile acid:Na+ symporter